jgi:RNA polymerase sigma-70 factor, ECF subfamily
MEQTATQMPQTPQEHPREGRAIHRNLVDRARDGDLDAFSALTLGRTNRLYAIARLILRDGPLAEDVVQEVLVRAWQDLRGLRDPDRFDAWLHRILVRTCYRVAEPRRLRLRVEVALANDSTIQSADAQHAVVARDQLERGFERLTADQRAVVVLHHYLGYSLAESAEILGIPMGTMQSRLHRALGLLRAALEADERAPSIDRRSG